MERIGQQAVLRGATDAAASPDPAVRAYARAGGDRRLITAAIVGFVAFNAGSTWLFGIAGKCGILHFASQFSGDGERFDWLVQGCTVSASVQEILLPDFLVMAGYWTMFTALLVGGWWRFRTPRLRRASWVLWLPTIALAFDFVEYFLLSALMYKRPDGQFAYRGDGGLWNVLQMAVSSAKWLSVAAMAVAGLAAAAVWFARRREPFPPVTLLNPAAEAVEVRTARHTLSDRVTGVLLTGLTVFVLAWVLAIFMTHCAIDSGRLGPAYCAPPPVPGDHFAAPSVVFVAVGLACLVIGGTLRARGAKARAVGLVLLAASLFLAVWLVWVPGWFRSIGDVRGWAVAAGVLIAAGVAAVLLGPPGADRVSPRTRTAVASAGAAAWALCVMYAVATSAAWSFHAPWGVVTLSAMSRWAIIAAGALLITVYVTRGRRRRNTQAES
ncbi:hypothetical protein E4P42_13105 [Mycobacterium sp. PS03-16]|uniref:hypothetical protein n=1 Tax=Mycobacterium sp. PS03-16 TaxID=2559611 RepID=UPI0010730880|nr:hypothetical protein [Mycobacterium sp. PS03-16]TFV57991.1 hypothetical protein E4P42_13105 [Mycobacterium sp. PS03-16]